MSRLGDSWERLLPRLRRLDLLVPVIAVVSACVYAVHGLHGALQRDLALYAYAGQQVADGVPPYLEVLNRAGPLAHVLPAVGVWIARLGGFDDVVTMRALFLLIATATTTCAYLLGRDALASRTAGLLTAATFLGLHGFIEYASNGPREKTPMVLFIVLTMWAVTHRRWFAAGLCVSLATLCLQSGFLPAITTAVVGALLLAEGRRWIALAWIALGGASPVAVLATWFALAGSLRDSVEAFLLINARYTVLNGPGGRLEVIATKTVKAYGAVPIALLVVGLVALAVWGVAAASRDMRRQDPVTALMPAFALGAVAAVLWAARDFDSWPDLFPLLPYGALGVGSVALLVERLGAARFVKPVTAVLAAAVAVSAAQWSAATRDDGLDRQRRLVDAVVDQLPPGSTMASVEAAYPLVLAGRTNPTRYLMFHAGLEDYVDDVWPGGLKGFARDLVDRRPTLIAVDARTTDFWRRAIQDRYVCVGDARKWSWWADSSLDPGTLADLRSATGYTSPADCDRATETG